MIAFIEGCEGKLLKCGDATYSQMGVINKEKMSIFLKILVVAKNENLPEFNLSKKDTGMNQE